MRFFASISYFLLKIQFARKFFASFYGIIKVFRPFNLISVDFFLVKYDVIEPFSVNYLNHIKIGKRVFQKFARTFKHLRTVQNNRYDFHPLSFRARNETSPRFNRIPRLNAFRAVEYREHFVFILPYFSLSACNFRRYMRLCVYDFLKSLVFHCVNGYFRQIFGCRIMIFRVKSVRIYKRSVECPDLFRRFVHKFHKVRNAPCKRYRQSLGGVVARTQH